MKKILLLSLFVWLCAPLWAQRQMVRLTRYEGFELTGVQAASGFQVDVRYSDIPKAVIEIPADMEPYVDFSLTEEGVVRISVNSFRGISRRQGPLRAYIYLNRLDELSAVSGASVNCEGDFPGSSVLLKVSSGASVRGVRLTGADNVRASAGSGASLEATVQSDELICTASSGSRIRIDHTGRSADLRASSGATITLSGDGCRLSKRSHSGGSIRTGEYRTR